MKKIYKAQVPIISGWKEVLMPIGSKIVHVGVQDDSHIYVGTVMVPHYVLHLCEVTRTKNINLRK